MNHYHRGLYSLMAIGAMMGMEGCIDHDYDLSKDIDLVVEVGGEITLPTSSVAPYTMKKIMNLPEDGSSSIRPDGELYGLAQGDYVLVQSGTGSHSVFSIPVVNITNLSAPGATQNLNVSFSGLPSGTQLPALGLIIGGSGQTLATEQNVDKIVNTIHMSQTNVNPDLVSLDKVGMAVNGEFKLWCDINGTRPTATIKQGFTVSFDPALSLEIVSGNGNCEFRGSDLVFTADTRVSELDLTLRITGLDCTKLASGQGLKNNTFNYDGNITTTGRIDVAPTTISGSSVNVGINTSFAISSASITSVTGVVNPKINIDNTSFAISDIPDFLNDGSSRLDIANPQVYLTVDNSSQASVDVSVRLSAVSDEEGVLKTVNVSGVRVGPGHNVICLSRTGHGNRSDITSNVTVSDLSELIARIPDRIEVSDCQAKVVQQPVEFVLGPDYTFTTANEVLAPLAFGSGLSFTYNDIEEGWDEDLDDYNFKKINITAVTSNTIPLSMTPNARAIFKDDPNGIRSREVRVNVSGGIAAGTLANPSESTFVVEIVSEVHSLAGLDGIEYSFTADSPIAGEPLNVRQSLTITKLNLTIAGGITMDLND